VDDDGDRISLNFDNELYELLNKGHPILFDLNFHSTGHSANGGGLSSATSGDDMHVLSDDIVVQPTLLGDELCMSLNTHKFGKLVERCDSTGHTVSSGHNGSKL
jgi:hypothetical protein